MNSTQALTAQDLALLRCASAGRALLTGLAVGLLLCFGVAGVRMAHSLVTDSLQGDSLVVSSCIAGACLAVAVAISLWMFRRRRRITQPLRAAVRQDQKRILRGRLKKVEILPRGRLRYTLGDEAIQVDLLLGESIRASHIFGRPLESFEHLNDMVVELHCIEIGTDIVLLLQVHYPETQSAARSERPATASDRGRADNLSRSVALAMAGAGLLAVLVTSLAVRHPAVAVIVVGSIAAIVWAATMLFFVLPRRARARRSATVATITGPVTEIISARIQHGRTAVSFDVRWYRIGGTLFCPTGAGVDDVKAQLGQLVKYEFLVDERRPGTGVFTAFETIAGLHSCPSGNAIANA